MARLSPVLAVLLSAAGLAEPSGDGEVNSKEFNFEIRTPPTSIDWEIKTIDKGKAKQGLKAHLQSLWPTTDPPSSADVYVYVTPMSQEFARLDPKVIASKWKDTFEANITDVGDRRKEAAVKLGGVDAYDVDITGEYVAGIARRSYTIAKNGNFVYTLFINRTYAAADDEDVTDEINAIRESFKFHEIVKPKAHKKGGKKAEAPDVGGGSKEDELDAKITKRQKIKNSFWKYQGVKPKDLVDISPKDFVKWEKDWGVVQRMERRKEQSQILIRIYVRSLKGGNKITTLEQHKEQAIKQFEETFDAKKRLEPEIKKWDLKHADEAFHLKLTGKRTTTEIWHWYMADCKNARQYRIYIRTTGTLGERDWAEQIKDFLKNFKVLK